MNGELTLAFFQALLFFGLIGAAVDTWLRSRIVFLYPAFGLIAFGAVAVPLIYVRGKFDLPTVYIGVGLLLLAGVIGAVRYGLIRQWRIWWSYQNLLLAILAAALMVLGLIQASQYLIPGGIDSAIHSSIIRGILVSEQGLSGSYPLGMHITIYALERIFDIRQELIFLAVYLIVWMSILGGIATAASRLTKWPIVGYAALAVGCLDVSVYNNLLNGSGTHLVGVLGIVALLLSATLLHGRPLIFRWIGLAASLSFLWYFHYPTIFFGIITLWAWRLAAAPQRSLVDIWALGTSLLITLPLQFKLAQDPLYIPAVSLGLGLLVVVEILLFFFGAQLSRWLQRRWLVIIFAAGTCWLFIQHQDSFLYLPTWYGEVLVGLAFFGLIATVLQPKTFNLVGLYSMAGVSLLYALLNRADLPGLQHVMVELGYYFGFAVSLILLGIAGLHQILLILVSRPARIIFVVAVTLYTVLVMVSRTYDRLLVSSLLPGDKPISRYEASDGFGIFYTPNDARLARWVQETVPRDGIIANPGGLYNTWAALTEHEQFYAAYNVPTIIDADPVISNLTKLLRGEDGIDLDVLLRRRIKYLLLPENFSTTVYHSRLRLRKRIGQARFYEIRPTVEEGWIQIPIGVSPTKEKIIVTTTGEYACRYCGQIFYFTQQDILHEIQLGLKEKVTIRLPHTLGKNEYELALDRQGEPVTLQVNNGAPRNFFTEQTVRLKPGDTVELSNASVKTLHLRAIGLREVN